MLRFSVVCVYPPINMVVILRIINGTKNKVDWFKDMVEPRKYRDIARRSIDRNIS
jgi:hypothetical protein